MAKSHWLTIASLAACAAVGSILFHESIHAVMCTLVGGDIQRFSAVHVNCECDARWKFKIVAASGSLANLLLAGALWLVLRRVRERDGRLVFFVWLFFSVNLFLGTGYWFASGLTNAGDWAAVIAGLKPQWLYQIGLLILGVASLMAAVAWALLEFGRIVSNENGKPIGQAQGVATICYVSSFVVMLVIGTAQKGGPFSFPGIAGLIAVLGGLSPMLWMMQWFRADMFKRSCEKPLSIERSLLSVVLAVITVTIAVLLTVLGQA